MATITLRQAYDKGSLSQRTNSDWDVALDRFSNKYCDKHNPLVLCALETAWCDGWDDNQENTKERRPKT